MGKVYLLSLIMRKPWAGAGGRVAAVVGGSSRRIKSAAPAGDNRQALPLCLRLE
jgi:hypothetical protein